MFDSTLNIGIFSGVVVVILVILIFENRNKFKKPTLTSRAIGFIKYLALVIPLKPVLTYLIYPKIKPGKVLGHFEGGVFKQTMDIPNYTQPLGYHIDNIFEYETVTFLYSFVLVILVYLFIPKKKKSE